ncbi:MAG: VOC family protein [Spongiibacteraceae bacterium]
MRFHHMCLVVMNLEESLKLYCDVLGFTSFYEEDIPGDDWVFSRKTLEDIFKINGAKSRCAVLSSDEGAILELQQPSVPDVQRTPREMLGYGYTGISELALKVSNIGEWFEKIKSAGYETQTNYIWSAGGTIKSFLFYDPDGNMIQLVEDLVDDMVSVIVDHTSSQ